METPGHQEWLDNGIARAADDIEQEMQAYGSWDAYMTAFAENHESSAFLTLHRRILDIQRVIVLDVLYNNSDEGRLVRAFHEIMNSVGTNSLRYGFIFGMAINYAQWFDRTGDPSLEALDQLATHVDAIFDEMEQSYDTPSDAPQAFRVFGDRYHENTLSSPIARLVDSACDEFYPDEEAYDFDALRDAATRQNDRESFRRGFGIARHAYVLFSDGEQA